MQVKSISPWRRLLPVFLLGLLLPATAAEAQAPAASQSCRRQCASQIQNFAQDERAAQVCRVRCGAGERHLRQQRRSGTAEATGRGVATRDTASLPGQRSLVAYAGTLPQVALAISTPSDRMTAHRNAEQACSRSNGSRPCNLLVETQDRCMAISRAVRGTGLVITRDPATYTVVHYGAGSGPTLAAARTTAIQDCRVRLAPGTYCRIAATRCG
ncbi:DUF4189 domain-containing protein [Falsiroseomonas sp. HC035]|uniref:DUF4189 domain-containing protein n=1 Tax=Falsiroseomonas sp. HC035 TaxID=3390999 RepID=UPI003D316901